MAATKESIDSAICNPCYVVFNTADKKGWRPNINAILTLSTSPIPPIGPDRAVTKVTRNVYEALGRRKLVNAEDAKRDFTDGTDRK